jgi:hypothetical protein
MRRLLTAQITLLLAILAAAFCIFSIIGSLPKENSQSEMPHASTNADFNLKNKVSVNNFSRDQKVINQSEKVVSLPATRIGSSSSVKSDIRVPQTPDNNNNQKQRNTLLNDTKVDSAIPHQNPIQHTQSSLPALTILPSSPAPSHESQMGFDIATEFVELPLPASFVRDQESTLRTDSQSSIIQNLQNQFNTELVPHVQTTSDKVYEQKWTSARWRNDQQFKALFGQQAFLQRESQANLNNASPTR